MLKVCGFTHETIIVTCDNMPYYTDDEGNNDYLIVVPFTWLS